MVKGEKESKRWNELTPEMMSEEEKNEDKFVRHPPSFRSAKVKQFIGKLERRLERKPSLRVRRVEGSPRSVPIPVGAKKWTFKSPSKEITPVNAQDSDISEELFSE